MHKWYLHVTMVGAFGAQRRNVNLLETGYTRQMDFKVFSFHGLFNDASFCNETTYSRIV
jgi:hypothetical protein